MADVHPLDDGHAWILAKAPGELAIADVDGDHALGAALQQDVGEAAGRGTHIETGTVPGIDGEGVERGRQFLPAAADIVPRTGNLDRLVRRHQLIGPLRGGAGNPDQARPDHRLRPFARPDQAACELGIPPAVASLRTLSRCNRTESMITLAVWAIAHATSGTTKYGFCSRLTGRSSAGRPVRAR